MELSRIPDSIASEAASKVAHIALSFDEQVGGIPTLGELLEVLALANPGIPSPFLQFKVKLKGGGRYKATRESRISELNDAVFAEAAELMILIAGGEQGANLTKYDISSCVRYSAIELDDLEVQDIVQIAAVEPKVVRRVVPGDLIAIPGARGYHMVVVVARNRFGTAFGILERFSRRPMVRVSSLTNIPRPVYADEHLIVAGAWRVVGHDENVLSLFPDNPEIFHGPGAFPGRDEFGSAETASGTIRMLDKGEAEEVGVLDGSYKQIQMSEQLQKALDEFGTAE